jgi:hypothetical protein
MKIEKVHNGIRYTLSNENLAVGDKVYPIAWGRCLDGGDWIFHELNFNNACSGFPDEPHTILDLHYSDYKPEQIRTDMGYSPIECYYKIIKMEKHEEYMTGRWKSYRWVEIPIEIPVEEDILINPTPEKLTEVVNREIEKLNKFFDSGDGNTGGEY